MKTILVIFIFITSSKCGVLKETLNKSDTSSRTEYHQGVIIKVNTVDNGTYLLTDPNNNIEETSKVNGNEVETTEYRKSTDAEINTSDSSALTNNITIKTDERVNFRTNGNRSLSKVQKREINNDFQNIKAEIQEILNIIDMQIANNNKTVVVKFDGMMNCTKEGTRIICNFDADVDLNTALEPKIQKREIKNDFQNTTIPTDSEIQSILDMLKAIENETPVAGEVDGKNCTTEGTTIVCNMFLPVVEPKITKREIKNSFQNNTLPTDVDIEIQNILNILKANENKTAGEVVTKNCTTTEGATVFCPTFIPVVPNTAFIGDYCPPETNRAADGACLEIV